MPRKEGREKCSPTTWQPCPSRACRTFVRLRPPRPRTRTRAFVSTRAGVFVSQSAFVLARERRGEAYDVRGQYVRRSTYGAELMERAPEPWSVDLRGTTGAGSRGPCQMAPWHHGKGHRCDGSEKKAVGSHQPAAVWKEEGWEGQNAHHTASRWLMGGQKWPAADWNVPSPSWCQIQR